MNKEEVHEARMCWLIECVLDLQEDETLDSATRISLLIATMKLDRDYLKEQE